MMQQVISLALPQFLVLLMLLSSSFWLNDNNMAMAKTLQQNTGKSLVLLHVKDGISTQRNYAIDYDDVELEPRRRQRKQQPKQRSRLKYDDYKQQQQHLKSRIPDEETTERPLIRYWNSFVRSVTVPMSNLRLNITNSLANFFNDGSANIMETPPIVLNDYPSESLTYIDTSNSKKRRRSHKKKRKSTIDSYTSTSRFEDQSAAVAGSYYYNGQTTPYYYYDSKTGKYYALQPLANNNNDYYKQLQLYNYYYPVNEQVLHAYDNYNNKNDMIMKKPVKKYKPSRPPKVPEDTPLSDAGEGEVIQDDDDAINNDHNSNTHEEFNNVVYEDDDNIAVVENLEDDEDDNENDEQTQQSQDQINESNQEQLRNALGSFMRDDRFSRLRQRTQEQDRRTNKNKPLDKQGPRQPNYKYYYMNV